MREEESRRKCSKRLMLKLMENKKLFMYRENICGKCNWCECFSRETFLHIEIFKMASLSCFVWI